MASDVQNLTTFYANLPSIFESDSANSIKSLPDATLTANDKPNTYQPMFGSFLFAESEPFTRAAFVDSTPSSIEVKSIEDEEQTHQASVLKANRNQIKESSPLAAMEDISDIDEDDDFDGIPVRHTSPMRNDRRLEQMTEHVEQSEEQTHDVEDLFLNGFGDEDHHDQQTNDTKTMMSSLFNNIPDIDDLNEHMDDEDDEQNRVPFDQMDMFDESDSVRSSSPDSVLSSSHLRDEDDDNYEDDDINEAVNHNHADDEDDVTQWNDDDLLSKATLKSDRPNAPLPPAIVLNTHSNDQVDFIDSSRSNSRCSSASSHLSTGYTDQARIFINDDDGLVTSSDSESDDDQKDNANIHVEDDILIRDSDDEEPSLQINLDYARSRSVSQSSSDSSSSDSPQSLSSPVPDRSPIVAIDEEIVENKKALPSAPIAHVDDEDDDVDNADGAEEEEEDDDLPLFMSNQSILSPIPLKNLIGLSSESRRNDIVHDIINIRHLLDENNDDDEFLAIIHNPIMFEQVLHDDEHEQRSDLSEQTNDQMNTLQAFSYDNHGQNDFFEHYQNIQQTSLLSVSNNSPSNKAAVVVTTTESSPTTVNHLPREEEEEIEEEEENVGLVNPSSPKLKTTQQSLDKNLPNINLPAITNCEKEQQDRYQMMDSDEESDNDSELLQTLAQLHGLVHTPRSSNDLSTDHQTTNFNHEENFDQNQKQKPATFLSLSPFALINDDESQSHDGLPDSGISSLLTTSTSVLTSNRFSNENVDADIQFIVNKLVSDTLELAAEQVESSYEPTEYFVEQILSEAVYQVYEEDQNPRSIDNLLSIIHWHQQPTKQILDPFDQKFDRLWTSHFQTPDDDENIFSSISNPSKTNEEFLPQPLFINHFTVNDPLQHPLTASAKNTHTNRSSPFHDDFLSHMDEPTSSAVIETNDQHEETPLENSRPVELRQSTDVNPSAKRESFFQDQQRLSQFDDFPSEQPLHTRALETIVSDSGNPFDEPNDIRQSTNENDEPWELEDQGEEMLKPIPTVVSQQGHASASSSSEHESPIPQTSETKHEHSDSSDDTSDTSEEENTKENYDDYFPRYETTETIESSISKTVRFDDNLQNVKVFTPKDSLIQSEVSSRSTSTSDSDASEEEQITPRFQTDAEQTNENEHFTDETNTNATQNITPRPDSIISLTSDDIPFPPPLPPLPPLAHTNDSIPSKSTIDLKRKKNSLPNSENPLFNPTTTITDSKSSNNFESELMRSHGSAILRSTSNDGMNVDEDEIDHTITCMIDNNEIKIDAKTISPFKCVINTAGQLHEENQTAVIILYGCWLPDHRLREYRYIMDQLFYYVYHKLEKLVINDYVLVYFHGATPKHRTPELKFLRKCYQMINFRLRKNLRAVYVVHPTRWLRTVVALSRPFFSNKFYHKVQYLFTIAELERQFPHNHIPIPVIIEQADWLYSQRYDRQNASIKRSIERSATRPVNELENESAA